MEYKRKTVCDTSMEMAMEDVTSGIMAVMRTADWFNMAIGTKWKFLTGNTRQQ